MSHFRAGAAFRWVFLRGGLATALTALAVVTASRHAHATRIDVLANGNCTITEAVVTAMNPAQQPQPGCSRVNDGQTRILVAVPSGTFNIPAALNVTASVTIQGTGPTTTTLTSAARGFRVVGAGSGPELILRDLALNGSNSAEGVFVDGNTANSPAHFALINARVRAFNIGVRIESPTAQANNRASASIGESTIENCVGAGVSNVNSDLGVTTSSFLNNGNSGIRVRATTANARTQISTSTIEFNDTPTSGGGISLEGSTVDVEQFSVSNSSVRFNLANADGGGISLLGRARISSSQISSNGALGDGGGIYCTRSASTSESILVVTDSTIANNDGTFGGGVTLESGGPEVNGTFDRTLFSGNRAVRHGGGIFSTGQEAYKNSTFSGNSAGNQGQTGEGGGIYHDGGEIRVEYTTIVSNTANGVGGGVRVALSNPLIQFNITANNNATTSSSSLSKDWSFIRDAGIVAGTNNLIKDATGLSEEFPPASNILSFDPQLGPLQNVGGPTLTCPIFPGSLAIDRITTDPTNTNLDQRSAVRPQNGPDGGGLGNLRDLGAFEAGPNQSLVATASASSQGSGRTAAMAKDGNLSSRWEPTGTTGTLTMTFPSARFVYSVILREFGNRVTGYRVETLQGSTWTQRASGTTIGSRMHTFTAVNANAVRLVITGSSAVPGITEFESY